MNPSLRIGSTRGQDLNGQQGTMNTSMMMNDAPFFSPGGIHTAGNTFYGPFNPGNDHGCIGHALCGLPNTPSVVTNTDNVPGVRVPRDDLFDIESTTPKPPSESPWSPFSIPGQAPPLKFSFRPAPAGGLPESSQGNVYQNVGRNQNSDGQADTDNRNGFEQNPGLNLSTQNCDQDLLGQGSAEPQELLFGGSQDKTYTPQCEQSSASVVAGSYTPYGSASPSLVSNDLEPAKTTPHRPNFVNAQREFLPREDEANYPTRTAGPSLMGSESPGALLQVLGHDMLPIQEARRPRTLSPKERLHAQKVRQHGGACDHCKISKRKVGHLTG
ncbi:MAG: hypothetical protein MMC33_007761 [Icmadophila ericetorum]|nr:hypothetical protein [Icmadophila ericetorum]